MMMEAKSASLPEADLHKLKLYRFFCVFFIIKFVLSSSKCYFEQIRSAYLQILFVLSLRSNFDLPALARCNDAISYPNLIQNISYTYGIPVSYCTIEFKKFLLMACYNKDILFQNHPT